jgi:hypothetical protein
MFPTGQWGKGTLPSFEANEKTNPNNIKKKLNGTGYFKFKVGQINHFSYMD